MLNNKEPNDRFANLPLSPFARLRSLLEGIRPGADPFAMDIGEPGHAFPSLISDVLQAHTKDYGFYPPISGTSSFRQAAADWLCRRFDIPASVLDPDIRILPVNGTREALFSIALIATPPSKGGKQPLALIPNPFYQCYAAGALAAGARPYFVSATQDSGHLPDFDSLPEDVLAQTALVYFCSPANPQGAVASRAYLAKLISRARAYDFLLVVDECYADIYDREAPEGAMRAALDLPVPASGDPFEKLLVFHSLSKRSSAPGLRSGFCAGDKQVTEKFRQFRNIAAPQTPLPVLAAAAAAWADDAHVLANQRLYRRKIDIAEEIFGNRFGFYRPAGGFFLWLDVGDGVAAAKRLWESAGIRVLPGTFLAKDDKTVSHGNPGKPYIRVALVKDETATQKALIRMTDALTGF